MDTIAKEEAAARAAAEVRDFTFLDASARPPTCILIAL